MKNFTLGIFLILGLCANSLFAQSDLYIDTTIPIDVMVEDFFDNACVDISNISFQGDSSSAGFYLAPETNLGINGGILLTTGSATTVADSASYQNNVSNNSTALDSCLIDIVPLATNDVAILEFDLESFSDDTVNIVYVFASEEYPEYVCSDFNDVFGFFVSGPSPDGTELVNRNIAMVPELDGSGYTDLAVAINSINNGDVGSNGGNQNCQSPSGSLDFSDYYRDNLETENPDIIYDGMTTVLAAPLILVEGGTYHIKISIADAADAVFDSGVFLGTASFCGDSLVNPVADFTPTIVDGVVSIENDSRYATEYTIDYGNGHVVQSANPPPYAYPVSGTYTVTMTAENFCCSASESFEVEATVVSVDEQLAASLTISPNPVLDRLFVYQTCPACPQSGRGRNGARELDCQVFDSFGRLISTQNMASGSIDVSELAAGLYYLRVNSDGRTATKKFYKQ